MKMNLIAIPLLFAAGTANAQVTAWSNEPGGVAVARDAADQVYTARWDYAPAGDIHVAKRSADGALLWEVRHDNLDTTRHEVATFVATDGTGNVFVSGTIRSGYSNPVNAASVLMKFGTDGTMLWRRVYGGSFDGSSTRRIVVDAAGRAYVLGIGVCANGLMGTIRQFDVDGSDGWTWCDAVGVGAPTMFKRTADGHSVIAARGIIGSVQGYARVDANGQTVWSLAGIPSLTAGDIAGDALGNSYIVHADPVTGQGTRVRKLAPNGAVIWERSHPMSAFRVEVGPDGAAVLGGFPDSGSGGAAIAKYSADGDLLWSHPDASGVGLLLHSAMLVDAAGAVYLSGSTLSAMGVAKVHADGRSAWFASMPGGSSAGMVLGSVGQVYLTGGLYTARIDQSPADVVFADDFGD